MSGSVFTTMNESFQKSSIGREKAAIGQGFTMMRTEIAPYRSSEHFGFTPKREMIPNAASESFIMSTKYKNGSKDDAILMGKWLSFHDRKWLTFKRPLTGGPFISFMMRAIENIRPKNPRNANISIELV